MRIGRPPHPWAVSPRQAVEIQKRLAPRVAVVRPRRRPRFVAGVDAAFCAGTERAIAGVVLWDAQREEMLEEHVATRPLVFPYVPGLLTFREAPAAIAALRKLSRTPDALLCDGQGFAHPRRFGLACHVGVIARLPTIGCGKTRLLGEHREPGRVRGSRTDLRDRGEVIGSVLRTQTGVRPVYVSIGHRVDLASAEEIVLACATRHRLPEPIRLADHVVGAAKRRMT